MVSRLRNTEALITVPALQEGRRRLSSRRLSSETGYRNATILLQKADSLLMALDTEVEGFLRAARDAGFAVRLALGGRTH